MNAIRVLVLATLASATAELQAQIIQLPTFHQFSVGTTVVVPDRGSAYLGGVSRSRYGSVTRGVPLGGRLPGLGRLGRTRGVSAEIGGSHAAVTATIHDFEAMDRALLGDEWYGSAVSASARKAAYLSRHVSRRGSESLAWRSVAEIRAESLRRAEEGKFELMVQYKRACEAESDGQLKAAVRGFQYVATRAHGDLRAKAQFRLAAVSRQLRQ